MSGFPGDKTFRAFEKVGENRDARSINQVTDVVRKSATDTKSEKNKTFIQKKPQKILHGAPYDVNDPKSNLRYEKDLNVSAFTEMISGEWQRLMHEGQPKTRVHMAVEGNSRQMTVLSERLIGYVPLRELINNSANTFDIDGQSFTGNEIMRRVFSGDIPGLGNCAMGLLTTLNADGHLGNVGVAKNPYGELEVFTIDAGQCYFPVQYQYIPPTGEVDPKSEVVPLGDDILKYFPFIINPELIVHNLRNFLDVVKGFKLNTNKEGTILQSVLPRTIKDDPRFLAEKHARILKEIMIPDRFVHGFMMRYAVPEFAVYASQVDLFSRAALCARTHNERKNNLKEIALKDPGFREYLKTEEAQAVAQQHIERFCNFVVYGKKRLISKNQLDGVKTALQEGYEQIFLAAHPMPAMEKIQPDILQPSPVPYTPLRGQASHTTLEDKHHSTLEGPEDLDEPEEDDPPKPSRS